MYNYILSTNGHNVNFSFTVTVLLLEFQTTPTLIDLCLNVLPDQRLLSLMKEIFLASDNLELLSLKYCGFLLQLNIGA